MASPRGLHGGDASFSTFWRDHFAQKQNDETSHQRQKTTGSKPADEVLGMAASSARVLAGG